MINDTLDSVEWFFFNVYQKDEMYIKLVLTKIYMIIKGQSFSKIMS